MVISHYIIGNQQTIIITTIIVSATICAIYIQVYDQLDLHMNIDDF